jgi:hypothetical protein
MELVESKKGSKLRYILIVLFLLLLGFLGYSLVLQRGDNPFLSNVFNCKENEILKTIDGQWKCELESGGISIKPGGGIEETETGLTLISCPKGEVLKSGGSGSYECKIDENSLLTINTSNGLSITGQSLSLALASATTNGALSAEDYQRFSKNGGGSASFVVGNITSANSALTVSGGNKAIIGNGVTLDIKAADLLNSGILLSSDFAKFDNKLGSITPGNGLTNTGTTKDPALNINAGNGLNISANILQAIAGDNSINIDSNGIRTKLDITGGLVTTANGIGIRRDCNASDVVKWDGNSWECDIDSNTPVTAGNGIDITGSIVSNTGLLSWTTGTGLLDSGDAQNPNISVVYGTTSGTAAEGDKVVLLAPASSAVNIIQGTGSGVIPLTLRGAIGQSSNLLVFQDSDQNLLGSISPTGLATFNGGLNIASNFTVNNQGNITEINNVPYSFPSIQGGNGQVLSNNGSGTLVWSDTAACSSCIINGGNTFGGLITIGSNDANGLAFETGGTEKARILTSGNFGIGATNPSSLLSVGSTSQFQVDSNGAIVAATGITSSGTITFSGLNSAGIVHTNASGVLSTSALNLTTDVTGILPVTNGGTGTGTAFTQGSAVFAGVGGVYTQDNANFFWDNTTKRLGIGDNTPTAALTIGSGDLFQVNSSGAVAAATGITSSGNLSFTGAGTYNFGGLSPSSVVFTDASRNLTSTGVVSIAQGGTNGSATPTAGAVPYGTGTAYAFSLAGSSGQFLISGGTGSPTWTSSINATSITNSTFTQGSVIFAGVGGALSQNNTNFFWDNTNIRQGIGTAVPGYKLHIIGANTAVGSGGQIVAESSDAFAINKGGSIAFRGLASSGGSIQNFGEIAGRKEQATDGNFRGYLQFNVNNGTVTERMRLDSNGNLGVGTVSPLFRVHAAGANTTVGNGGQLIAESTDAFAVDKGGSLAFRGIVSTGGAIQNFAEVAGRKEQAADGNFRGYLQFSVNNGTVTERMRIDSNGNVAVGNTSPVSRFDITGTGTYAAAGTSAFNLGAHTVTLSGANPTTYATFNAARINTMTLAGTNLGQTVTNASALSLAYPTASTNTTFTNGAALYVPTSAVAGTTNSYGLLVAASSGASNNYAAAFTGGNVGIGNAAPANPLDVTGNINTTGVYRVGGVSGVNLSCATDIGIKSVTISGGIITAATCTSVTLTDLAENFGTNDATIQAGDIVAVSQTQEAYRIETEGGQASKAFIEKASQTNNAIGVIATNPEITFGQNIFTGSENPRPVALSGRVPVKVNSSNGDILKGDYITLSTIPGIGAKAVNNGYVVGRALNSYSNSNTKEIGEVLVFINPSFFDAGSIANNKSMYSSLAFVIGKTLNISDKLLVDESGNLKTIGNITANTVQTNSLNIAQTSGQDPTIGNYAFTPTKAGNQIVEIKNKNIRANSKIFITLTSDDGKDIRVTSKVENKGFTVKFLTSSTNKITFDYWIVEND